MLRCGDRVRVLRGIQKGKYGTVTWGCKTGGVACVRVDKEQIIRVFMEKSLNKVPKLRLCKGIKDEKNNN